MQQITDTALTSEPFQAEHVYMHTGGTRIHYQVAGPHEAPVLILLHGIGGCVNWWRENLPVFSRYFRTYALDLPGFGHSWRLRGPVTIEAKTHFVKHWMDAIGIERAHVLGHSMGGQIAVRLAALYPERVERLALAAPSGLWLSLGQRLKWSLEMPKVSVPLNQTLTIATGTMRTDMVAFGLSLRAILQDQQARDSLSKVTAPTLLLWGQADGIVPPTLAAETLGLIKKAPAQLKFIARGTHNMMFDQAAHFNRLVLEFLLEKQFGISGSQIAMSEDSSEADLQSSNRES
ncbi:MAG TPA: alpha/beta fold hydrolase [Chloroflexia bacterium]|nr:alpha/beta fold hydrolase [Chloroflexia bacterium]